jgi:hypothetical protein
MAIFHAIMMDSVPLGKVLQRDVGVELLAQDGLLKPADTMQTVNKRITVIFFMFDLLIKK